MNLEMILPGIQAKTASIPPLGNTMKFDFGKEKLFIDGTGDSNTVSTEDKDADCLIQLSFEDFMALTQGELNPMMAVMTGKIKIKGDMGVAMKLQSLFS